MYRGFAMLIALLGVCLTSCTKWGTEMPSDKLLSDVFAKDPAEFDRLLKMFQADPAYQWIDLAHTYPENPPLPGERWKAYRSALDKLHLAGVERKPFKPGIIFFNAAASGNPSGGKTKGYAHSATALPTVDSLDAIDPKKRTTGFYFMRLDGEWYLFLNMD